MASYKNRLVEATLLDYPKIHRDMICYGHYLDSQALNSGDSDLRVDGGRLVFGGDRYLERFNDPKYKALYTACDCIYNAVNSLAGVYKRIILSTYIAKKSASDVTSELGYSLRRYYQLRSEAFMTLYDPFIIIQPYIEAWREGKLN